MPRRIGDVVDRRRNLNLFIQRVRKRGVGYIVIVAEC